MTPTQKKNLTIGAVLCCLFFHVNYFAISFEPEFYPGTTIKWHDWCDSNRTFCPYCIWWFIASCVMKAGVLFCFLKHLNPKLKEERTQYLWVEFMLLLTGNWAFDLARKVYYPTEDCISLSGDQVAYSLLCLIIFLCRLYPENAGNVWRGIKFVALLKFIPYLIKCMGRLVKKSK